MIEINNISKVFRTSEVETVALNHVNLEVKEGEFVARSEEHTSELQSRE